MKHQNPELAPTQSLDVACHDPDFLGELTYLEVECAGDMVRVFEFGEWKLEPRRSAAFDEDADTIVD